jgi:multicomponent Na+:H+ antiporter subunit B
MNVPWRQALLVLALFMLLPAIWRLTVDLAPFGDPTSLYRATINALLPSARHVTNMVAAVNFDVRGFDTLGEECILIAAVTGTCVLLRGSRGEKLTDKAGRVPGRAVIPRSDATVMICRIAATLTLVFGIYMVLHGTVTPGGGFQGGVIIASGLMLLYLGEGYQGWRRVMRSAVHDGLEGGGAFAFVAAAALPLLLGYSALENALPLGQQKDLYSGGLMVIANLAVGVSVTGSFGQLLLEFMEETRSPEDDPVPDEADR